MNLQDAKIAMRALNLDGGEGSGVKGHTTEKQSAIGEARERTYETHVNGGPGLVDRKGEQVSAAYLGIGTKEYQSLVDKSHDIKGHIQMFDRETGERQEVRAEHVNKYAVGYETVEY